MNTELLNTWLGLPAGAWPPDDRALLGLPAGTFTAVEVETRALGQMEKLRTHQLVHADLVTEGMNRLAQALIALTDEANRLNAPPARPADADIILDASKLEGAPRQPVVLEAEVVAAGPRMAERVAARKPKKPRPPKPVRLPPPAPAAPVEPPVTVPEVEPVPPGTVYRPEERRKGYAELVALRRLLARWEKLQPYFAAPSESLDAPSAVFGFVESVRECRRTVAIDGDVAWFDPHGHLVLALVRNPHALPIFRTLQRSQRQELATDWALATAHLRARHAGLRREMRKTKPKRKWGSTLVDIGKWLKANPEWMMGTLLVLAVVIAFVRTIAKPAVVP